jgi:alpha-L-fucosidase 2
MLFSTGCPRRSPRIPGFRRPLSGSSGLAYRCLVPLLNRYWLHNLASMHNAKKLFNMDISGGLPAVLIKMLVASDPGVIRLFPARPQAWPSGTIEGVLCRGQVEIRRLTWKGTSIEAALLSAKAQDISLFAPGEIRSLAVRKGRATIRSLGDAQGRRMSLPAGEEVVVELELR